MTSIEWLIEEMLSKGFFKESVTLTNIDHLQYKAEEMHNAELGKTWDAALDAGQSRAWNVMRAYEDFDDWYQVTFVSKGSDDTPMERKLLKSGFVDVVPKQETLYTEEQVREIAKYTISEWASLNEQREHDHDKLVKTWLSIELQNFIKSLKQPKN
jgi:hypothetical protein